VSEVVLVVVFDDSAITETVLLIPASRGGGGVETRPEVYLCDVVCGAGAAPCFVGW
jgi:hypothetical protein